MEEVDEPVAQLDKRQFSREEAAELTIARWAGRLGLEEVAPGVFPAIEEQIDWQIQISL